MSVMMRLITFMVIFIFSLLGLTLTSANLVKRDSNQQQQQRQLMNSFSGHSLDKRPFCNAFTGCGKKRSFSIPNYPNLPSQIATLDDLPTSLSSSSSSSSSSSPFLSSSSSLPLSLTSTTSDDPMTPKEWLNYFRAAQKLMDDARYWQILQNKVNQFGSVEIGQNQRTAGLTI